MSTILKDRQWYIIFGIWIAINFLALMVSNCTWEKGMYYPKEFFPFSGYPNYFYPREKTVWKLLIRTYSYSEFFVYSLPAVVGFFMVRNRPMREGDFVMNSEERAMRHGNEAKIHFQPVDKINQDITINPDVIHGIPSEPVVLSSNEFRIVTATVGLSVYVIRYHNGIGMPEFIGKTPLTLKLTPFIGNKLTLSNGDRHASVVVRNSQEYYFKL